MFTENNFKGSKILIVDDEKDKLDGIWRTLHYKGEWELKNLIRSKSSEEAIEAINEHVPDIVLLDLKIPRTSSEGKADIENAVGVLSHIEIVNHRKERDIKVIIISGSVEDKGTRKLISGDRSNIVTFLDKGVAAIGTDVFSEKLLNYIKNALTKEPVEKSVSYDTVRNSMMKGLKKVNEKLWNKIEEHILDKFEKISQKNANVHPDSNHIIAKCGEIVEDIIYLMQHESYELSVIEYSKTHYPVRDKLNALTGRKFIDKDEGFELNLQDILISRPAAEYALMAYKMRNQAVHSDENDNRNDRIFKDHRFTIEDAAISINLIVPLIKDYIAFKKKKIS